MKPKYKQLNKLYQLKDFLEQFGQAISTYDCLNKFTFEIMNHEARKRKEKDPEKWFERFNLEEMRTLVNILNAFKKEGFIRKSNKTYQSFGGFLKLDLLKYNPELVNENCEDESPFKINYPVFDNATLFVM